MTPARMAQLHRWQLLGAAARKGRSTARTDIYRKARAAKRKMVVAPIARAAAWGVSHTALPIQMVSPLIPGYQIGDRTYNAPSVGRARR